ncbi:MAG: hypothetical protein LBR48_02390 [Dysgonamonadaceae bacterium]|jgi:hypothetical protein|nr:hypothetical protein [Dysgonamonadaceae bacterium]
MKTVKIIQMVILLSVCITNIQAQKTEVKGNKNTYILKTGMQSIYSIWNRNNTLKDITPSYLLHEVIPPITIVNRSTLDSLVFNYFPLYFKQFSGTFRGFSVLSMYFFADINGNIKEMSISYPKEIGIIPATIIEEFEAAVLQSNVKLSFDKDHPTFKGSAWVGQYALYDSNKLQNYK